MPDGIALTMAEPIPARTQGRRWERRFLLLLAILAVCALADVLAGVFIAGWRSIVLTTCVRFVTEFISFVRNKLIAPWL